MVRCREPQPRSPRKCQSTEEAEGDSGGWRAGEPAHYKTSRHSRGAKPNRLRGAGPGRRWEFAHGLLPLPPPAAKHSFPNHRRYEAPAS